MSHLEKSTVPYRQIRALYDDDTITVYQAYSTEIAEAAVREQRLHASPDFLFSRMTWIKPSWCWMMYRSAYSTKDSLQSRILALKMSHKNFLALLSEAVVCCSDALTWEEKRKPVRVQWDPERSPAIGPLSYRSIQIGIGEAVSKQWAEEWIEGIQDVTEIALRLKVEMELRGEGDERKSTAELVDMGCMPLERVYEVPDKLRAVLKMDDR